MYTQDDPPTEPPGQDSDKWPGLELQGLRVVIFLTFWGISTLFSRVTEDSLFSTSSPTLTRWLFSNSHSEQPLSKQFFNTLISNTSSLLTMALPDRRVYYRRAHIYGVSVPAPPATFGILSSVSSCLPNPGSTVATKAVSIWLANGAKRSPVVPDLMASSTSSFSQLPLIQGCRTHFHQGPHQPHGCLQRAKCNFRTV